MCPGVHGHTAGPTREYGLSFFRSDGVWLRAWALVQQGGVADDVMQLQQAIQTRVTAEGPIAQPYILAHLAGDGQVGQPAEGLRVVAAGFAAMAETHGEWWYAAELYRLHGELVLQQAQQHPESVAQLTSLRERRTALPEGVCPGPAATGQVLGTSGGNEPESAVAPAGQHDSGPRPARSDLPDVY